jgi:hypothetical protein
MGGDVQALLKMYPAFTPVESAARAMGPLGLSPRWPVSAKGRTICAAGPSSAPAALDASASAEEVDEEDDHGNDQKEVNQGARDVKHAPPENPRDDENCGEPDHRCLVYGSSTGSNVAQDTEFAGGTQ